MAITLYDEEQKQIRKVVAQVQMKYKHKPFTYEVLGSLHKELTGRLTDIGYDVTVDVTPLFQYQPVDVVVNGRLDPKPFDHDKKRHEILKSREEGGI